jgi:hypothetical protein
MSEQDLILTPCFSVRHDQEGTKMDSCESSIVGIGSTQIEIALDPDFGIAFRK